jgi:hypothetical protein
MQEQVVAQPSASRSPAAKPTASQLDLEIAAYDKVISAREEALQKLKVRRRILISRRTGNDPDLSARRVEARWGPHVDREKWREGCRQRALASPRALPPMTPEQRKEYDLFRKNKRLTRAEALRVMGLGA